MLLVATRGYLVLRFNRTFMELKLARRGTRFELLDGGFNRTFMELK